MVTRTDLLPQRPAAGWLRPSAWAVLVLGLTAIGAAPGRAVAGLAYAVTDLGTLGGRTSQAFGIDDRGDVVGRSEAAYDPSLGYVSHAFVYRGGAMTDLQPSGLDNPSAAYAIAPDGASIVGMQSSDGLFSRPYAISLDDGQPLLTAPVGAAMAVNDLGHVVGFAADSLGYDSHAFLIDGPVATDLGALGDGDAQALAINHSDQVAGLSAGRAFVWQGGTMTDLGPTTRAAYGINDAGQVVGAGQDGAFLWQAGRLSRLGDGVAYAINNQGVAVGTSDHRAMLYANGQSINLNVLIPSGYTLTEARGINAAGQIIANGDGPDGAHAFLLTPTQQLSAVPEPSSVLMCALGATILGAGVLRTRRA